MQMRGVELMPRDVERAAQAFGADHPIVRIEHLNKSFDETKVLRDVNLGKDLKLSGKTVRDVLPERLQNVPAADAGDTLSEVAAAMARLHTSLIAVVKDGELHGVITASRLLAAALRV